MKEKLRRQAMLLQLVRKEELTSQQQMVGRLRRRGISATQSSVSRDVRDLGLVRIAGRYVPASRLEGVPEEAGAASLVNELIISSEPVGANLVVVRTAAGTANAVAVELDRKQLPEVAGTIAGDDTIFIAVRSRSAQGRLLTLLRGRGKAAGGDGRREVAVG